MFLPFCFDSVPAHVILVWFSHGFGRVCRILCFDFGGLLFYMFGLLFLEHVIVSI